MYRCLHKTLLAAGVALAALGYGSQAHAGLITNGTFTSAGTPRLAGWTASATSTLTFRDTSTSGSSADGLMENVGVAATSVPEPASMALLGLGLASLYGTRRRARR